MSQAEKIKKGPYTWTENLALKPTLFYPQFLLSCVINFLFLAARLSIYVYFNLIRAAEMDMHCTVIKNFDFYLLFYI
jgi:hypothetical protein